MAEAHARFESLWNPVAEAELNLRSRAGQPAPASVAASSRTDLSSNSAEQPAPRHLPACPHVAEAESGGSSRAGQPASASLAALSRTDLSSSSAEQLALRHLAACPHVAAAFRELSDEMLEWLTDTFLWDTLSSYGLLSDGTVGYVADSFCTADRQQTSPTFARAAACVAVDESTAGAPEPTGSAVPQRRYVAPELAGGAAWAELKLVDLQLQAPVLTWSMENYQTVKRGQLSYRRYHRRELERSSSPTWPRPDTHLASWSISPYRGREGPRNNLAPETNNASASERQLQLWPYWRHPNRCFVPDHSPQWDWPPAFFLQSLE